jgi:hypothetical protein
MGTLSEAFSPTVHRFSLNGLFLDKLGTDDVEQTKRRGKKLVVVGEEAADLSRSLG